MLLNLRDESVDYTHRVREDQRVFNLGLSNVINSIEYRPGFRGERRGSLILRLNLGEYISAPAGEFLEPVFDLSV